MDFRIADTFTDALARLPVADQKAVKTSAFDLQTNPEHPGLQMHRIDKSRDPNFWSVRVNADVRIILHKTEASLLLAYVDHHDKAYAWATRRRIEAHPKTGAVQIVEVRERVEEIARPVAPAHGRVASTLHYPFAKLADDQLLSAGVPVDWLADVRTASEDEYLAVPRLGRDRRLGSKQREQFWPVFSAARASLELRGFYTWPGVFTAVTRHFAEKPTKPFTHVVIDEAQDLGVPELRFIAAIAPEGKNALFFSGDLGQRIFQQPFSWKALGVDIRGRAAMLKVNYRTSHQIRRAADKLLPGPQRDVDGVVEERKGTVSVFNGPDPKIVIAEDEAAETTAVAAFIR